MNEEPNSFAVIGRRESLPPNVFETDLEKGLVERLGIGHLEICVPFKSEEFGNADIIKNRNTQNIAYKVNTINDCFVKTFKIDYLNGWSS